MRAQIRRPKLLAAAAAAALAMAALPAIVTAADTAARLELARDTIAAASAFDGYVERASAMRGDFADARAVSEALSVGATYRIAQIEQGEIAYGALVALQDPAFVRGVRERARKAGGYEALAEELTASPHLVMQIEGSETAAALVEATLRSKGEQILLAGRAVKQAAYDVQRKPWSRETVPDQAGRLARVKALSNSGYAVPADGEARLMRTVAEMRGTVPSRNFAPSPVVTKALALAAVALSGKAGEDNIARLQPILSDARSNSCLKMAKLNLYQCLAVAGPHYEDVFCLGQHVLLDTGKCVTDAAGASRAVPVRSPTPTTVASATIPVAED